MKAQTKTSGTPKRNWVTEGVIITVIGGAFGVLGIWLGRESTPDLGPTQECRSVAADVEGMGDTLNGQTARWENLMGLDNIDLNRIEGRIVDGSFAKELALMAQRSDTLGQLAESLKSACL